MAVLLIDLLRTYVAAGKFTVHDFVVMPDHIHLLLSVDQLIVKGGFSHRAKKELGFQGEIWQPGFSEVRITDRRSFLKHREYIDMNPVRAGFTDSPEKFPYGSAYLKRLKKNRG